MLIDLQLHSTYSDGYLTPTELVNFLAARKVKIASLTDHHTIAGLEEFKRAGAKYKIKCLPGLELYVKLNSAKFNILWYNFKDDPRLHNLLRLSQVRRRNQARKFLIKLKKLGLVIDIENLLDKYSHYLPLNRLINDLLIKRPNRRIIFKKLKNNQPREDEIIHQFFKNKKIGVWRESYIDIKDILNLRRKIGGQIILNHPGKYNHLRVDFINKLKRLGLDGLELISPHHSINAVMYIQHLARQFDFITTGGSDFHRLEGGNFSLQSAFDYLKIEKKYLRKAEKIIGDSRGPI